MSSNRTTKTSTSKQFYHPRYNPSSFVATMQRLKSLSDTKIFNNRKNEYIAYSQSLKQLYQLQDIDLLLNDMLDNQLFPNVYIINQLMQKLHRYGFNYIYDLHRIAVNKGIANDFTYNIIIDMIAKSANPNACAAIELLEEAKKARFANSCTYNSTINAIARSVKPKANEAIRLLEEAKQAGFANGITYNCTIEAIAKSAKPNVNEAIRLLEEAKRAGFANVITYNSTIDAIAKSVNPNAHEAIRLLEEARLAGMTDEYTYVSTIDAIAKSANPNADAALKLLEEARLAGIADKYTYVSTIDAIAKSANPDGNEAIRVLEEAKTAGCVNKFTYSSIIDVIAKSANPNVNDAMSLLEEAKQAGFVHKYTYASTIEAIAKSVNPNAHEALRLLEEAKTLGFANTKAIYNSTLDAIAKSANPNTQDAIRLLEEAKKNGLLKLPIIKNGDVVDLHGLTYGSAYFWLKKEIGELLLNSTDIVSITFIYGKGLNSKTNEATHPVKQAVLKITRDMKHDINDCNEEGNIGRFHINFQRKKLQGEWHNQVDRHGLISKQINKSHHSQRLFKQKQNKVYVIKTAQDDSLASNSNQESQAFRPSQTRNY